MLAAAVVEQMELALKAMVELVAVAMLEQRERLELPILEAVVVAAQLVVVIQVAAVLSSSRYLAPTLQPSQVV
jgi:hypothetical protein